MDDSLAGELAGLALAAGAGMRLRPLTMLRPKPLCPVGDRPLLDWGLDALAGAVAEIAVNAHHRWEAIEGHMDERARDGRFRGLLSVESPVALGTAGAVGALRDFFEGRGALIINADTWHRADLRSFVEGWDGERVRLLTSSPLPFGPLSGVVASILPWSEIKQLNAEPSGLWESTWRAALSDGRLDAVHEPGVVIDCGTPADYLRANLAWSGGESVIGEGAVVEGTVERSVVWPGSVVRGPEHLVDAIRAERRTVLVR